jgi:hypothetical protein
MRMTGNTAQSQAAPRCHHPLAQGLDPTPSINGYWIYLHCGAHGNDGLCEAYYRVAASVWEAGGARGSSGVGAQTHRKGTHEYSL